MPIRTSNEETQYLDKYGYRSFFSRISTGIKPWDLLSSQTVPEIRYNPNILLLQLNYFQGWYQGRARGTTAPYRKWYPHCKVKNYFFGDFWHLKYPENNTVVPSSEESAPLVGKILVLTLNHSRCFNPGSDFYGAYNETIFWWKMGHIHLCSIKDKTHCKIVNPPFAKLKTHKALSAFIVQTSSPQYVNN